MPELGTLKAKHMPLVVLTSNNTRELSEALKRRCLYLYLDYPNLETELSIVRLKVPDLAPQMARQAVELVHRLRELDLKKHPSVSETLDWAQALVTLNASRIDQITLDNTLTVLLKHEHDVQRARRALNGSEPARAAARRPIHRSAPRSTFSSVADVRRSRTNNMEERLVEFIAGLRAAGVRISVAESADSFRAIEEVGVFDRDIFRSALRTTLIKDPADVDAFDRLFPLYFGREAPPMLPATEGMDDDQQQELRDALDSLPQELADLLRQLLDGQQLRRKTMAQMRQQLQQQEQQHGQSSRSGQQNCRS